VPASPKKFSYRIQVFKAAVKDERGNTESALVLIPLLFLFLCAMQFVLVIFLRNESLVDAQNQASVRAISGALDSSDRTITLGSAGSLQRLRILVTRDHEEFPILVPGLGSIFGEAIKSAQTGIAVMEVPE
jgi:hypothetical protein